MNTKKFKPPPEVAEFGIKRAKLARQKTSCRAIEFILSFFVLAAVSIVIYNYDLLGLAGLAIVIALPIAIAVPVTVVMERRLRREREALRKWLATTKEQLGKNAIYTSGAVRTVGLGHADIVKLISADPPIGRAQHDARENQRAYDLAAFKAVSRLRMDV